MILARRGGLKILLVLVGLALLIIGLVVLRSKPDERVEPSATMVPDASQGFAFEVHVALTVRGSFTGLLSTRR